MTAPQLTPLNECLYYLNNLPINAQNLADYLPTL